MGYWADWDSTDQVAERAIDERLDLAVRLHRCHATAGRRTARASPPSTSDRSGRRRCARPAFLLHNSLNLFSNFTYFLDDPENGDQFEQAERRIAAGGRVTYRRLGHFFERHTESAVGVQVRRDWLDPVGLYHTAGAAATLDDARGSRSARRWPASTRRARSSGRATFRTTFGLRADVYQFSVTSDNPLNSGDGSDGLVSPKFGAVFGPWDGTEVYANAGMGFHSNDARGAAITRRSGDAAIPPIA